MADDTAARKAASHNGFTKIGDAPALSGTSSHASWFDSPLLMMTRVSWAGKWLGVVELEAAQPGQPEISMTKKATGHRIADNVRKEKSSAHQTSALVSQRMRANERELSAIDGSSSRRQTEAGEKAGQKDE